MPGYYIYLLSSLPMLNFEASAPFSFERFLEICRDLITDEDIKILESIPASLAGAYPGPEEPTLDRWHSFDTALRNELVRIRSSHKRLDPEKFLRQDGAAEPSIMHTVIAACRNPSILEAERALDKMRWDFLDELETGRYFDTGLLVIYACKLLILRKWDDVAWADKTGLLEKALT